MQNSPSCPKCDRVMQKQGSTPAGKTRWRCTGGVQKGFCYTTTNPNAKAKKQSGDAVEKTEFRKSLPSVKRYIITSAQNGTPAHAKFLGTLKTAAAHLGAELVVIPIRYKNPTSSWQGSQANAEIWDDKLVPYLFAQRKKLGPGLILLADIKTQPTAESPLTGFESITHAESGILGHSKLQLRCVPTPLGKHPKLLVTTGSCTVPNYTDTKAGKKGEFHHAMAACLVEIDSKRFHIRQLNADRHTGEFTDLQWHFAPGKVTKAPRPLALIMGDTHVDFIDPKVYKATFGKNGIVAQLKPTHLAYHDLNDSYARNPHHYGNVFNEIAKLSTGANDVRKELERAIAFVRDNTPAESKAIIVPSNHVDFLTRWIKAADWRDDAINAEFYLETALAIVKSTKLGPTGLEHIHPFTYWAKQKLDADRTVFLSRDESFQLAGIELGYHGDAGPNGSRGSIKNMRRIGTKTVIGHSHTPGIEEGCYQVGTSTALRAEYTVGPSSWLNTHCLVYASGKRSLINIIDGEWRL